MYIKHKTQLLIPNNHPLPKQNQKYWRWQNIGTYKIHALKKVLALTKYRRWQNIGVDKILALTKYWRWQNIGVDKILALTKSWRRQEAGADKMLAQTQKNPLTVWLGKVHSCWLLPDLVEDLLRLSDGVALFACSRQVWRCLQPSCFYGQTLSPTVLTYCTSLPCWKHHKFFALTKYRRPPKIHWF